MRAGARYRLRSPQVKEPVNLEAKEGPLPVFQPVILCRPDRFEVRFEYGQAQESVAQVFNPNEFAVQIILERPEWSDDILTAVQGLVPIAAEAQLDYGVSDADVSRLIAKLRKEMKAAADRYDFERAAALRDRIFALQERNLELR